MTGENQGDGAPSSTAEASSTSENVAATTTPDPATIQQPVLGEKPTTVSTDAFEGYLLQTLLNLQCRAQVESTVQDLVTDVEFAVDLQDQLSAHTHQEQAERIIAAQEYALEETHVVQKDRLKAQTLLADALVKDLWGLSKEVGSLLELKQKHQAMILEYDELMAKLAQAEEDLYAARRNPQPPQQQPSAVGGTAATLVAPSTTEQQQQKQPPSAQKSAPNPVVTAATVAQLPPQAPPSATIVKLPDKTAPSAEATSETTATKETTPEQKPPAGLKIDPDEKETPPALAAESAPIAGENPSDKAPEETPPAAASPKQAPQQQSAPVVALVEDDDDDNADGDAPVGTLENIDMEILMRIFGFLDAIDILNTAQSNISMYSRVDSLFGFSMDGGGGGGDDNVSTTSTLATTPTVAAATVGTSTTASASTATTTKSAPAAASATKKAAVPAEANNPMFGQRLLGGGGRNIFNMLQSGVAGATGANGPPAPTAAKQQSVAGTKGRGGAGRGDTNDGKPPLSAAMANSMAAKLNDAEINAIISMTEKLRSKEKQVSLLIKDKEEAEGKLKGSEAVKDFLINKVRDMEKIMNKSDETEKKVTQQIASDQEVIAFLDGRVQELERTTRTIQKEKNAAQEELKAAKAQNDKKVAVLSDMLQFERQKVKENERDWKATKKLLVKEVKTCRVQIVALQAERDGFREQNDVLRKAVMSSSNKF